ncbi:MAG TPA: endolytic transglycosylase MltG [Pseudomonadales bacterium]
MKQKFLLALIAAIFFTMLSAGLSLKYLSSPLALASEQQVEVLYGDTVYKVAGKLQQQGVLEYPTLWIWYARLFDMGRQLKAGEYRIRPGMSPLELLDDIVNARVIDYPVTLIEGWTTADAIRALHSAHGIVATLAPDDHAAILRAVNADPSYRHSEGLFFPSTYRYIKGTRDRDILERAYQRQQQELAAAWQQAQGKSLPYKTPYDLLIMASIIEKETAVDEEREQIAGVFVQRLNRGMRLQTDPTVIYGMGERYQGRIGRADLLRPTPYNTYTRHGMPPTPIALPGQASLQAAANPLLNDKLYFVGKGDGYHHFSATLPEHNEAVRRYQLSRPGDYRSTPAP